jgi:hypothetical protein
MAVSSSGHAATAVMLCNVVASYSGGLFPGTGLFAGQNAILRVAHSVVTGNGTGVFTSGGTIFSYGDNDIDGNASNGSPTATIPTH